ncbi:MAG: DUF899 family protein [Pseudomonadota bacterium]
MTGLQFPNENEAYRNARQALLDEEVLLRQQVERVAEMRRALPSGGLLKTDYVFQTVEDDQVADVTFSDLFAPGHTTLFVYSFMYSPTMDEPCSMCTSMVDGLNGQIDHLQQKISTAVVAKHDPETLRDYAALRGWDRLPLLSSAQNTFNQDYHAEKDGRQQPMAHVFLKDDDSIRHFWSSELLYGPAFESGNPRHVDQLWPLWNILDLTPSGRGDWYPSISY